MAQLNNDPTTNLSPNLCDYCHQRPKFLPYNYCGRTCGARATAVGNQVVRPTVVMCKQCNQRPVYQNHQFCGRKCADAWTAAHEQTNTGSWSMLWPSPWNLNQAIQGGGQPGQNRGGRVVNGFVKGFRGLISPANQTQQQQTVANPTQTQQPPNNPTSSASTLITPPPITVLPSATSNQLSPGTSQHPFNLPSPTNGDNLNQNNNKQLDPFNGAYPTSPPPVYSTSSGSSVPQVANNTNPDPSETTPDSVWNGMSLPSYSTGSLGDASEPDVFTDALPGSYPDQEPGEDEGGEDSGGDILMEDMDVQSIRSSVYPPSVSTSEAIGTCRLEGCSNPTSVDSITDLESEYCSQKHQEEAMGFERAALCILCRKMPRGPNDHFCSVGCRARAMFP